LPRIFKEYQFNIVLLQFTVKLCSKVAKIRVYNSFHAVFDTKRVSENYDSCFDSGDVTA